MLTILSIFFLIIAIFMAFASGYFFGVKKLPTRLGVMIEVLDTQGRQLMGGVDRDLYDVAEYAGGTIKYHFNDLVVKLVAYRKKG